MGEVQLRFASPLSTRPGRRKLSGLSATWGGLGFWQVVQVEDLLHEPPALLELHLLPLPLFKELQQN
jgi:hypothetical protein